MDNYYWQAMENIGQRFSFSDLLCFFILFFSFDRAVIVKMLAGLLNSTVATLFSHKVILPERNRIKTTFALYVLLLCSYLLM